MTRINLRVPFSQKEEVRALGARWDATLRTWYVPEHVDPGGFARWRPAEATCNVRSASYFIATATRECWRCLAASRVLGFIVPPGHEVLSVEDDPKDDHWEASGEPSLLSYIDWLPDAVVARIQSVTQRYRIEYSNTIDSFYWMNSCEHCESKLGDNDTFNEFATGFGAISAEQAAAIRLRLVQEPFSASVGSFSVGLDFFEAMTLA